jgi:hypothetical protein
LVRKRCNRRYVFAGEYTCKELLRDRGYEDCHCACQDAYTEAPRTLSGTCPPTCAIDGHTCDDWFAMCVPVWFLVAVFHVCSAINHGRFVLWHRRGRLELAALTLLRHRRRCSNQPPRPDLRRVIPQRPPASATPVTPTLLLRTLCCMLRCVIACVLVATFWVVLQDMQRRPSGRRCCWHRTPRPAPTAARRNVHTSRRRRSRSHP